MDVEKLIKIIFTELKNRLESSKGLSVFAHERAKFEGWLKVELCDVLSAYVSSIIPEKLRVDVTFDDWLIELKTVNTNVRYSNVKNKHRPITKNIQGVIDDVLKLKKIGHCNKAIVFVAFPIEHDNDYWEKQLVRIRKHLRELKYVQFEFKGNIPGVLYFGTV